MLQYDVALAQSIQPELDDFALAPIFTDHMVLQQNEKINIYGSAPDGAEVAVSLDGNRAYATSEHGRWVAVLPEMKAGGPYHLIVQCGIYSIERYDILIGEVWLLSGQSNMARSIDKTDHYNDIIEETKKFNNEIRIFSKYQNNTALPDDTMGMRGGYWMTMNSEDIAAYGMSCVSYYFAKYLNQRLGVPVGIITSAYAGTPIQEWMNPQTFLDSKYDYNTELTKELNNMGSGRFLGGNYNAMIYPFRQFKLRGFVWYQGENNVLDKDSEKYLDYLTDLINDWRAAWGDNALPFVMVQIPGCDDYLNTPGHSAIIREANLIADKTISNTSLIVINDLDDTNDIHPTNKKDVGKRIADNVAVRVYGQSGLAGGPMYTGYTIENGAVYVSFEDGEGLYLNADTPVTFRISGADGIEYIADTTVENGRLKISSEKVSEPMYASYGWGDNCMAELFNKDGYPASPFRTNMPHCDINDTMHSTSLNIPVHLKDETTEITGIEGADAEDDVCYLVKKHIIPEGHFEADGNITTFEFSQWIAAAVGKSVTTGDDIVADGRYISHSLENMYTEITRFPLSAKAYEISQSALSKTDITKSDAAIFLRRMLICASRDIQDNIHNKSVHIQGEYETLTPLYDTYISNFPSDIKTDGTFGSSSTLATYAVGHIKRRIMLGFDLTDTNNISNAKRVILRLYLKASGNKGNYEETIATYGIENVSWSQTDMSWNSLPYYCGKELDVIYGVNETKKYYEWDVTDYVKNSSEDLITLSLEATGLSRTNFVFCSTESGSNAPQLLIYK